MHFNQYSDHIISTGTLSICFPTGLYFPSLQWTNWVEWIPFVVDIDLLQANNKPYFPPILLSGIYVYIFFLFFFTLWEYIEIQ